MASDLSWGYRTRQTGMSGKERRGGGVFERHGRSYHTRRQRVAKALGFTGMTAVGVLGSVDELTDGTGGSVDAAMGVAIGPYRESRSRNKERRSQKGAASGYRFASTVGISGFYDVQE